MERPRWSLLILAALLAACQGDEASTTNPPATAVTAAQASATAEAATTVEASVGPASTKVAGLIPSEVSGDDCAGDARIDITPDAAMRQLHQRQCEAQLRPEYTARCAGMADALTEITFVTDHCVAPGEAVEVSLDGVRYDVFRIAAPAQAPVPLIGVFDGDGLRMQVSADGEVSERREDGEAIGLLLDVEVVLTIGAASRTLKARYSDGP